MTEAAGGADRRSAKNAAPPINQSREAHRSAWPLHSPRRGTELGRYPRPATLGYACCARRD
jgi:hypothetical protein